MAKKRRKERKQLSRERGMQQAAANVGRVETLAPTPVQPRPSASPRESAVANTATANVDEYAYIRSDLKRIAILATSIIAILVVLSFMI
jgi:hypothetical protein